MIILTQRNTEENKVTSTSKLEFVFVTGVETLLSSTTLIGP
jgi:hypothetical protein